MTDQRFEMTQDLITLLRNSWVSSSLTGCGYGAAEIDPKRPYGNGDVATDIATLLNWDIPGGGLTEEQRVAAWMVHELTPVALQVVLSTGMFELGAYRRATPYGNVWVFEGGSDA